MQTYSSEKLSRAVSHTKLMQVFGGSHSDFTRRLTRQIASCLGNPVWPAGNHLDALSGPYADFVKSVYELLEFHPSEGGYSENAVRLSMQIENTDNYEVHNARFHDIHSVDLIIAGKELTQEVTTPRGRVLTRRIHPQKEIAYTDPMIIRMMCEDPSDVLSWQEHCTALVTQANKLEQRGRHTEPLAMYEDLYTLLHLTRLGGFLTDQAISEFVIEFMHNLGITFATPSQMFLPREEYLDAYEHAKNLLAWYPKSGYSEAYANLKFTSEWPDTDKPDEQITWLNTPMLAGYREDGREEEAPATETPRPVLTDWVSYGVFGYPKEDGRTLSAICRNLRESMGENTD